MIEWSIEYLRQDLKQELLRHQIARKWRMPLRNCGTVWEKAVLLQNLINVQDQEKP